MHSGDLETGAEIRCLCHWVYPERGGPAPVSHSPDHAGQQRVSYYAKPGTHGPAGAGKAPEHLGPAAQPHHQCGGRHWAHQVRQRHRAFRGPFS